MARSVEEIVQNQLGSQALLIANLTSQNETMQAKIIKLEAEIKDLKNVSPKQ